MTARRIRRLPPILPVAVGVDRPRWSVMIPTYNSDEVLADALATVLAQDPGPEDMQICVVDDASTTGDPGAVVSRLGGGRVQFVAQAANVGAPVNFTSCVRRSVGRWVHVLHADDLVDEGFYAAYAAATDAAERAGTPAVMVAGRCRVVDGDGELIGVTRELTTRDGLAVDARDQIARHHPLNFAGVVVARSAYERVGGFDPQLVHANDWDMWCRLAAIGPVAVVDDPLATYRRHEATDTEQLRRTMTWLTDTLAAVDRIAADTPDPVAAHDARRFVHGWLSVEAERMAERSATAGRSRLAVRNALWSLRLDPSPARLRWTTTLVTDVVRARTRR